MRAKLCRDPRSNRGPSRLQTALPQLSYRGCCEGTGALTAQAKPGIARVVAARRASDQVQMPEKTEFRLAFRECPETSPSKGRSRQERLHTLDSEQAAPSTRPLSTPLTKVGGVTLCGAVVAKRADWEAPSATPSVAPGRRNSQGRSQVRSQLQQRLKTRAAVEPSPEQRPDRFHPLDQGRRSESLWGCRGKESGLGGPRTPGHQRRPGRENCQGRLRLGAAATGDKGSGRALPRTTPPIVVFGHWVASAGRN
jgi:hypothetical protein